MRVSRRGELGSGEDSGWSPGPNLLVSALLTAVLWSIVRPLFTAFLQYNPDYGVAFGSLKAIFVLVVWIYYTFAVILFGTEVLANTRRREALLLSRLLELGPPGGKAFPPVPTRFIRSFERGETIFEEDSRGRDMFYQPQRRRLQFVHLLLNGLAGGGLWRNLAVIGRALRPGASL